MYKGNGRDKGFSPVGSMVWLDLWGIDFDTLNNPPFLCQTAKQAAEKAGMRVFDINITPFQPQGLSLALIWGSLTSAFTLPPSTAISLLTSSLAEKVVPCLPPKSFALF